MQCNIIIMHPITVLLHMYSTIQFSILQFSILHLQLPLLAVICSSYLVLVTIACLLNSEIPHLLFYFLVIIRPVAAFLYFANSGIPTLWSPAVKWHSMKTLSASSLPLITKRLKVEPFACPRRIAVLSPQRSFRTHDVFLALAVVSW